MVNYNETGQRNTKSMKKHIDYRKSEKANHENEFRPAIDTHTISQSIGYCQTVCLHENSMSSNNFKKIQAKQVPLVRNQNPIKAMWTEGQ